MTYSLPDNLKKFESEARLHFNLVKDIEFSGPTYQVLVEDPVSREDYWVFLQLNNQNSIRDAFCSCDEIQEHEGCLHLTIAYLSLFKEFKYPLHQRFARSLWNHLCRLYEERLGGEPSILSQNQPGEYRYQSRLGKNIFELRGKTAESIQILEKIIYRRDLETEETSLKFSNLSHEDILSWKEGNPNPQLRFDLSFWSDLAKWFMKKQEDNEPYEITFKYSKKNLPNFIHISFQDVEIGFYLSSANLPLMIESFKTVKSPLAVYHANQKEIDRIIYDKHEHVLKIIEKVDEEVALEKRKKFSESDESIRLDGWIFIPEDGFYAEETHELLKTPILHGDDIVHVLNEHTRLIASLIVGCTVYREPVALSYHLYFDPDWNLHITAYLFEKGDLEAGDSWLIENWAYLDQDGFYLLEGNRFETLHVFIPFLQVSDFVSQNRTWLNNQEGFQTHVKSIEYQLSYQVTENQRLTFSRKLIEFKDSAKQQDFGLWVYWEGYGFYSKEAGSFSYLLKGGISLSPEQIPLFIRMNSEELSLIPRFFISQCPVKKAGLRIELVDKKKVKITPEYHLNDFFKGKNTVVFDDFIYVQDEGFFEIPINLRIPEKYRSALELEGDDLVFFLTFEIESLMNHAFYIDPRLLKIASHTLVTNFIEHAPEKGRGWYNFRLFYQTEKGNIHVNAIKQAMGKKFPFAFFSEGMIDLRDEGFNWLKSLDKNRFEKGSDKILLSSFDYMKLNAFNPIELLYENDGSPPPGAQILTDLNDLQTPESPNIEGLKSDLRPYQEIGLHWLWFLYSQQLSGLLCDDMGLGKTHQAMALFASVKNLQNKFAEGLPCHFLVVCPTSVIYHWQEKIEKFLPHLRLCTFYGIKRNLDDFPQNYDVLLTSYGILRNERELISKFSFEVAIFDEIQVAKNQYSLVYSSLKQVKAQMKLGLTGTPIENHLRELKSLFDVVLPTYMPGEQEYRNFFIKPIEKQNNFQRKKLLHRLIHPFTLRRKKADVLKDLPEKIEEILFCDLTPHQEQLYSEVLLQRRTHLLEELKNQNQSIPYLHIFSLLSSLKQICDHPAIYLKTPLDYQKYTSGKWNLFVELLREALESQQKVVVFSQYLGMLDIMESYLKDQHIEFATLRGSTQNRKEQLQRFSQDKECKVFIGSLHAAGLGVDLTAGSVVIHYDRWWNAAREEQATDRVHRIGQTRGVQVIKLVTKGTFEEKINAMIARKGKLMEDIIGVDDQNTFKTFSRNELIELLEFSKSNYETILDTE